MIAKHRPDSVEDLAHGGVLLTQRLLADGDAAPVQRLGLTVAALGTQHPASWLSAVPTTGCSGSRSFSAIARLQHGQVVERRADIGMVPPPCFFADDQTAHVETFGLGETALPLVDDGQPAQGRPETTMRQAR
jgi:hypothetical protein